ncbi:DNA polymerase III subunit delta' [Flavisphingomonas formosensis]|uniref:DNA polymerase III subunit delta' n=1 Tax=Flavisphingomonas formosensis TaxID=861534 RepID=UPI0012F92822|nr:DNA polymerase III subunit delta' [Sphingomonas formosensis]
MSIIGQHIATEAFCDALQSGRIHHAWLLAGPRGIGKARFAEAAARRLLAEAAGPPVALPGLDTPEDHPTARLIAAGSHPDFRRLERAFREKTNDHARNITVDQVRSLQTLFATTPSFSDRRAVIIDAADDMERGAANALLKNLEEPPAGTVFFLVSHAPGRLLPTIRSRCRVLRFGLLDDAGLEKVLRAEIPDASGPEIAALVRAGEGSPGRAMRFAGLDIASLDQAIADLIREGDPGNGRSSALARALATKAAQPRYEAFLERVPGHIADVAKRTSGTALAHAIRTWEEARALAGGAVPLSLDPQATVFTLAGLLASLAPTRH